MTRLLYRIMYRTMYRIMYRSLVLQSRIATGRSFCLKSAPPRGTRHSEEERAITSNLSLIQNLTSLSTRTEEQPQLPETRLRRVFLFFAFSATCLLTSHHKMLQIELYACFLL